MIEIFENMMLVEFGVEQRGDEDLGFAVIQGDPDQPDGQRVCRKAQLLTLGDTDRRRKEIDPGLGFAGAEEFINIDPVGQGGPGAEMSPGGQYQGEQPESRVAPVEQDEIFGLDMFKMLGCENTFTMAFGGDECIDGDPV